MVVIASAWLKAFLNDLVAFRIMEKIVVLISSTSLFDVKVLFWIFLI